ncbi:hypothetical protein SAMN05443253_11829 [Bacillus sp. OK048]|nr:hypothetical protein SAMN05443253_11829 [Bacillus sp. OK048]
MRGKSWNEKGRIPNTTLKTNLEMGMCMKNPKHNKIPFIILLVIHVCLLGYSFYKTKNKKQLFILLMSNVALAYLLEFFVLNLYKAYKYKPRVLKKKYFDNTLGAILSQTIFVPFTAVFLTSRKIGWIGKILGGVYFSLVEIVFLRLKVYKHHWWKTVYTLVLIPFYFKISDWWNCLLTKQISLIRFISLFFMIMVTEANLIFVFATLRKIRFGVGRVHSLNEHFIVVPLYAILYSLFSSLSFLKENNWISKRRLLIFSVIFEHFFNKVKLVKEKFYFVDYLTVRVLTTLLYGLYRDWVYGKNNEVKGTDSEEYGVK